MQGWFDSSPDPELVAAVQQFPALVRYSQNLSGAYSAQLAKARDISAKSGKPIPADIMTGLRELASKATAVASNVSQLRQQFAKAVAEARAQGTLLDADYREINAAGLAGFRGLGALSPADYVVGSSYVGSAAGAAGTGTITGVTSIPAGGGGFDGLGVLPLVLALSFGLASIIVAAGIAASAYLYIHRQTLALKVNADAVQAQNAAALAAWQREVDASFATPGVLPAPVSSPSQIAVATAAARAASGGLIAALPGLLAVFGSSGSAPAVPSQLPTPSRTSSPAASPSAPRALPQLPALAKADASAGGLPSFVSGLSVGTLLVIGAGLWFLTRKGGRS